MIGDSISRRTAIKLGAAATLTTLHLPRMVIPAVQAKDTLNISVSSYRLDRTAALFDGRVPIKGCDPTFHEDAIGDMNTAAFSGQGNRHITEIGLHPYMLAYANDGFRDYALLPIFLLRQFRHKSVFVRTDKNITQPQDLKGRRVGTPGYSSTSLTWIRGIFEDEYRISPKDVEWVIAAGDSSAKEAGKISEQESRIPEGVRIVNGPEGMDESDLLVNGQVDALFHAATPKAFLENHPIVARLFPDYRATEQEYYGRTGIFPIMHVLAIRRDVASDNPWLAGAVFEAYSGAKKIAYQTKDRLTWVTDMLPWYSQELENTRAIMGNNFYPYGIAPNRKTLGTLFSYSHRQGLASRKLTIDELFLPGTLEFDEDKI